MSHAANCRYVERRRIVGTNADETLCTCKRDGSYYHARYPMDALPYHTMCDVPLNTVSYKVSIAEFGKLTTPPVPPCPHCAAAVAGYRDTVGRGLGL